jgi:hypothetical protein
MGPYEVLQLLEALQAYIGKGAELCVYDKPLTGAVPELLHTAAISSGLNLFRCCW